MSQNSTLAQHNPQSFRESGIEFCRTVNLPFCRTVYYMCKICILLILQTLTKEWVDPVLRPPSHFKYLANLPANRLRQRQREIALEQKHAVHKQGQKKTPPKLFSALEVFPQLKRRVQQG